MSEVSISKSQNCSASITSTINTINPNMTQKDYQNVVKYLQLYNGYISKCKNKVNGKVIGYLVRIESDKYPNTVFINYKANTSNNQYFNKASAIAQTMKKGNRLIEHQIKTCGSINYPDHAFEKQFVTFDKINLSSDSGIQFGNLLDLLLNNSNQEYFKKHIKQLLINKNCVIIEQEMFKYMVNFERKGLKYYKDKAYSKKFITLDVSNK